jgi:hypothetical protein
VSQLPVLTRVLDGARDVLVYCDPPWSAGNAASFRTKAGMRRKVDFGYFLHRLVQLFAAQHGPVFCEMGRENLGLLHELLSEHGGDHLHWWPITYYGKQPAVLTYADFGHLGNPRYDPSGMDDDDLPLWVAQRWPQRVVLDPCCGRGTTALGAHRAHKRFVGCELHPRRMAVTLDKLREAGAGEPRVLLAP